MDQMHGHEPLSAAARIIGELVALRAEIRSTAEGFAVLDFAQGRVATELPADTARDLVAVLRGEESDRQRTYLNDLVLLWLESYRRAYSQMIMRVLEDDADALRG
jgi:hypothetical protein